MSSTNQLDQLAQQLISRLDSNRSRDQTSKQHIAEIVRHGDKLVLPDGMPTEAAIELLTARAKSDKKVVEINEVFPVFVWDGALALKKAVESVFGIAVEDDRIEDGFFGPMKVNATSYQIEVGNGQTVQVPWGRYALAATDNPEQNYVQCETAMDSTGQVKFRLAGQVQRRYLPLVQKLSTELRRIVAEDSIYRGKAVRVRFNDANGNPFPLPEPKFFSLNHGSEGPIFSDAIHQMVTANVYTPLRYRAESEAAGVPFKRGVLLAGPFGTGKTLVAHEVAKHAVESGVTYLYLEDVRELTQGLRFAEMYSPCVIFAEDLDRATSGDRSVKIDTILNTLDGVDTKTSQIMVVCTTNNIEKINQAVLRPGRFDAILSIDPPDAKAAGKLIRRYAGSLLDPSEDITQVSARCAGLIPAIIREVVERSKLNAISRHGRLASINSQDLQVAINTMESQRKLLEVKDTRELSNLERAAKVLADSLVKTTEMEIESLPLFASEPVTTLPAGLVEPRLLTEGEHHSPDLA